MADPMGFIVEVRTKSQKSLSYKYGDQSRVLEPNETFIGYFRQTTEAGFNGTFKKAYIQEIQIVDHDKKLFEYGEEAVFPLEDISINIWALRGPESNNTCLPPEYQQYETWNNIYQR